MIELLKTLHGVVSIVCSVLAIMLSMTEMDYETNLFKKSFGIQRVLWQKNSDEINTIGLALLMIFVTIFIWPANLVLLIASIFIGLCSWIWKGFKYLFRKKKGNNYE